MRTSFLLSLVTVTVVFSGLSAQAETVESANPETSASVDAQSLSFPATAPQSNLATTPAQLVSPITVDSNGLPIPEAAVTSGIQTVESAPGAIASTDTQRPSFPVTAPQSNLAATPAQLVSPISVAPAAQPIPGTALTSASDLKAQPSERVAPAVAQADRTTPGTTTPGTTTPSQTVPDGTTQDTTTPGITTPTDTAPATTTPDTTTQDTTTPITDVSPGRATRSGSSYIGIGGNIGLGTGDTALGEGSFAAISKIGLTRYLSVRPTVFIDDDPTILIPLTYDLLPIGLPGRTGFSVAPYLGVGAAISVGDDSAVDFLISGGVDVPLSPQFTATAAVNVTAFDNTAVGLLIGIGYNFLGF
jgi:hypothetical protein